MPLSSWSLCSHRRHAPPVWVEPSSILSEHSTTWTIFLDLLLLFLFFLIIIGVCCCCCCCLFVFWDLVSLCSPGCPGTDSVDQADLELRNLPATASWVLGLKACATKLSVFQGDRTKSLVWDPPAVPSLPYQENKFCPPIRATSSLSIC